MLLRVAAVALLAVPLMAGTSWADEKSETGNAAAGKTDFQRICAVCHSPEKGTNKIGPSLFDVVGRKAGTLAGYSYSTAMKNFGKTWTPEELHTYLEAPQKVVPGTKMTYAGVKSEKQRNDIIVYLETLK